MKAILTEFSHRENKIDVTCVADDQRKYIVTGYHIYFTLQTHCFRMSGECDLNQHPLSEEQIEEALIARLNIDMKETASEGIQGMLTKTA